MLAAEGCGLFGFGMHVHLLLHLHWTASMITHVRCAQPFTLGNEAAGRDERGRGPKHVRYGEECACRIR